MQLRYFLKLLTFVQCLMLSQHSHVQVAKQHIRTEIRSALGQHYHHHPHQQHHHNNNRHNLREAGSHYHNGQRVQRLYHPNKRWSGRRQLQHQKQQQHFSVWSKWSPCEWRDEHCVKRRERFCRWKRKCGHTKHVEERKCWSCHKVVDSNSSSGTFMPHAVLQQQQQQSSSNSNTSPAIIINAAAAASSGALQPTPTIVAAATTTTSPLPPYWQQQAQHQVPPEYLKPIRTTQTPIEIVHPYAPESEDSDELHSDFYVLKTKRKIKRQRKVKNDYVDFNDDYEDYEDYVASDSTEFATQHKNLRKRKPKPKERGRQQRAQLHQKNLAAAAAASLEESNADIEGNIFQYEDFDFEPETSSSDSLEQNDYVDDSSRNGSSSNWQTLAKERATPDALIPRHRRIYSKWSRWTKCSPKCTTRRYKKCRIREQCGREVLREIAYCYTEGSFCQQWLQAQLQKTPAYEMRPATAKRRMFDETEAISNNAVVSDYIMNGKGYRGPEYTPLKLKCGIAPIRSNKRNMYNMLKIIGGKAARKGEWPWQVAIFNRFKEAFCGGTLIAAEWVLTAAHCVRKVLYVRVGEHNLDYEDGTELQLRVLKSFKHPNFDKKTVDSDVALLKLPKPVNTTTWIGFSCLPRPYQPLPKNMDCTVIGWGKRRNRDVAGTSVLHQAEVPIISMDNCRSVYEDYTITKNMFCAGHKRGRIDTCAGDSGGPLLCRDTTKPNHPWTIFGITSFGDGCAKRNKFGIYAKVPNYVDWVWSVINCNGNCKLHQRNFGNEQ